jgi:hypothetical protein
MANRVPSVQSLRRPRKAPVLLLLTGLKIETAALSTDASTTSISSTCLVADIRPVRRIAYPAGDGSAAILPNMAPKKRRVREKQVRERGRKFGGRPPLAADAEVTKPEPKAQRNLTDPESRIMMDGATKEFVQTYNA